MRDTKLFPCPFCGGTAKILHLSPDRYQRIEKKGIERWQVACDKCGTVSSGKLSEKEAIESWNRRVLHPLVIIGEGGAHETD